MLFVFFGNEVKTQWNQFIKSVIAGYADSRLCVCQSCLKSLVLVVVRSRVLSWFGNLVLVVVKTYSLRKSIWMRWAKEPNAHSNSKGTLIIYDSDSAMINTCTGHGLTGHKTQKSTWQLLRWNGFVPKGLHETQTACAEMCAKWNDRTFKAEMSYHKETFCCCLHCC